MPSDTIYGAVTATVTVTLDGGLNASPLMIASTGSVAPTASGATAVESSDSGVSVQNEGSITGGGGGYSEDDIGGTGGTGVDLASGATLTNGGVITGGDGGDSDWWESGSGGIGVYLASGGTLTNTGTIDGGTAGGNDFDYGGNGGIGVDLASGGTLTNDGTIAGGSTGYDDDYGFGGPAGVYLDGGMITNDGTIIGGSAGIFEWDTVAVQFGTLAGTLAIDPGAVFEGGVYANTSVDDVLELAGTSAGTITGIGSQFWGFATIDFAADSIWSIAGTTAALTGAHTIEGFGLGDAITLDGYSAISETYVAGTGLELTDGVTPFTLDFTGDYTNDAFVLITANGDTTIELTTALISIIPTAVNTEVTLGSGAYASGVTITDTGSVAATSGPASVYGNIAGVSLTNQGTVSGGYGSQYTDTSAGGMGGIGVDLTVSGTLTNDGSVTGGDGGRGAQTGLRYGNTSFGGTGGAGVYLNDGTLANDASGNLDGGDGGFSISSAGGSGGDGVDVLDSGALGSELTNDGSITGGAGGFSIATLAGSGGNGVDVSGSEALGTELTNDGTITGGAGGNDSGTAAGGSAGAGIRLEGGVVGNYGFIAGGAGGSGLNAAGGQGGTGADLEHGDLTNYAGGTISGGAGGYGYMNGGSGGNGVDIDAGTTLVSDGAIVGGAGGGSMYGTGGQGGSGVYVAYGAIFTNNSNITGGVGGASTYVTGDGAGGAGGAGVNLAAGTSLTNDGGTIIGGGGGYSASASGGQGGAGVYLNGGTLTTSGTIAGGAGGGTDLGTPGATGDAVLFGDQAGTLVVDPGAVFDGIVAANASALDVLELAGTAQGTLGGLGTQFTGFSTIEFDPASDWSIEGTTAALTGGQIIEGFATGDAIMLDGFSASSEVYLSGTGLELSDGVNTVTLDLTGDFTGDGFQVTTGKGATTVEVAPLISVISTAVTTEVTPGSGLYTSALSITGTGSVTPGTYGATAVYSSVVGANVLNQGGISGDRGTISSTGGAGVDLSSGGTLTNDGTIYGGQGGGIYSGTIGAGGTGVELGNGGTLANFGFIAGGAAGAMYGVGSGDGSDGGAGVDLIGSGLIGSGLSNYGAINGGNGGGANSTDGTGGTGVYLAGGSFDNENPGAVTGGQGSSEANSSETSGQGGTGVFVSGGALFNYGHISGGAGGAGNQQYGGAGGSGVVLAPDSTLINQNEIYGGQGGSSATGNGGGGGGGGVDIGYGSTLTNYGLIDGGPGGQANTGFGGQAGFGVYLDGGTLINSGTIAGGEGGGTETGTPGIAGDAVIFGLTAGTLEIDPGAVFDGNVVANYGFDDVMVLGGTTPGTLGGIGTQFSYFSTIDFAVGSEWNIEGTAAALTAGQAINGFAVGDTITLDGFSATSNSFVPGTGLELSNGVSTVTLDLTGDFSDDGFVVTTAGNATTVEALITTISTAVTTKVTLGNGDYASQLTIASTGEVAATVHGATAVYSSVAGAALTNQGRVTGGQGHYGKESTGGTGGIGVDLASSGTVDNDHTVTGGRGGYSYYYTGGRGGIGVALTSGGVVENHALISGGSGGDSYYQTGGAGGTGIYLGTGGLIFNSGQISGGTAGNLVGDSTGTGGIGGAGVDQFGGTLVNYGTISGGGGGGGRGSAATGGTGGAGVDLTGAVFENAGGSLVGGSGHAETVDSGGAGGAGAELAGGTGESEGPIFGGAGGASVSADGGAGGNGVDLTSGENFTNSIAIVGGDGGYSLSAAGGAGGTGVYLDGGTLVDGGIISGGSGGGSDTGTIGGSGDAVQFGAVASTLIVDPGAVFDGNVVANDSVDDVLELNGSGALAGLGTQFTGFSTIEFDTNSQWSVEGNLAALTAGQAIENFVVGDAIVLDGFSAISEDYVPGTGLELSDGVTTVTLDINGGGTNDNFQVTTANGATTIEATTLSTALASAVTLGSGNFADTLSITDTGSIAPNANGATGVTGSVAGVAIENQGSITGGEGAYRYDQGTAGQGGIGVDLALSAILFNYNAIAGGTGGYGYYAAGGTGGVGVDLGAGGELLSEGSIVGGAGGYSRYATGGQGGAGAYLDGGTLGIAGLLSGGAGGQSDHGVTGAAGDAVIFGPLASTLEITSSALFVGGVVANSAVDDTLELAGDVPGTLAGLGTEFTGFSTIEFASDSDWSVAGTVSAFDAGQTITDFVPGDAIVLDGFKALSETNVPGTGLELSDGVATVTLDLTGDFTSDYFSFTVAGGATTIQAADLISVISTAVAAEVSPGSGDYARAVTVTSSGSVTGETGVYASTGGIGVDLTSSVTLTNQGAITGGAGGGAGLEVNDGSGGLGGNGADVASGTLANYGTITGGAGGDIYVLGSPGSSAGNGGDGVYLDGGTLVNAGTITAGAAGVAGVDSGASGGSAGDAVWFGALASTLVIDPGAVFDGAVVADAGADDVLELGGSTTGTLTGLGTEFTGFTAITEGLGAVWTLAGANSADAALAEDLAGLPDFSLAPGATLVVTDTAADLLQDPAGVSFATGVVLSGANIVDAAQAATLAALTDFSLAPGATLIISDTAADLLQNPTGLSCATGVLINYGDTSLAYLPSNSVGYQASAALADAITGDYTSGQTEASTVTSGSSGSDTNSAATPVLTISTSQTTVSAANYSAILDGAVGPVTIYVSSSVAGGTSVVAGSGGGRIFLADDSNAIIATGDGNYWIGHQGNSGALGVTVGDGNDTINSMLGASSLSTGTGNNIFNLYQNEAIITLNGLGHDTVNAGVGDETVTVANAAADHVLISENGSFLDFTNGSAVSMIRGGGNVNGFDIHGELYSISGGATIDAGAAVASLDGGATTINAGGSGAVFYNAEAYQFFLGGALDQTVYDQVTDNSTTNDTLVGGSGYTLIDASGSSGDVVLESGSGSSTLTGSTSVGANDTFEIQALTSGSHIITINDWNAGDTLELQGFGGQETIDFGTITGGITAGLTDGTLIIFSGLASSAEVSQISSV